MHDYPLEMHMLDVLHTCINSTICIDIEAHSPKESLRWVEAHIYNYLQVSSGHLVQSDGQF